MSLSRTAKLIQFVNYRALPSCRGSTRADAPWAYAAVLSPVLMLWNHLCQCSASALRAHVRMQWALCFPHFCQTPLALALPALVEPASFQRLCIQ